MKIQLKRSSVLDGGAAKAPTASQMEFGELAINFESTDPTLFYKDSGNSIRNVKLGLFPDLSDSSNQSGTLDDRYVKLSGGTLTGDLTGTAFIGGVARVSATPPSSAVNGELWYNKDDGRTYIYYTDADSSQWVDAAPDTIDLTTNYYSKTEADTRYLQAAGDIATGTVSFSNAAAAASFTGPVLIGNSGVSDGIINSDDGLIINIDADNDSTSNTFEIAHNGTGTSGTTLFTVDENGNGTFTGTLSAAAGSLSGNLSVTGTATFNGSLVAGPTGVGADSYFRWQTSNGITVNNPAASGVCFQTYDGAAADFTSKIFANGSAEFAGGNTQIFVSGNQQWGGNGYDGTKGSYISANGTIYVTPASGTEAFLAFNEGSSSPTATIKGDGSAKFANSVDVNSQALTQAGTNIRPFGVVQVRNDGATPNVFEAYVGGNAASDQTVTIAANGAAVFGSTITAGSELVTGTNIFASGSAQGIVGGVQQWYFSSGGQLDMRGALSISGASTPAGRFSGISRFGSLLIGSTSENVSDARCSIDAGAGNIRIQNPNNTGADNLLRMGNANNSGNASAHLFLTQGYYINPTGVDGTGAATKLMADGSATFADNGLAIETDGQLTLKKTGDQAQPYLRVLNRNDSMSDAVLVYGNGSATFAGAVAVESLAVTKGARADIHTLTDAATITPNFTEGTLFTVTIAGNRTIANPTNASLAVGQSGSIWIIQSGGGNTISWGSYWEFPGGVAPTLSTAAGAVDRIDYIVRSGLSIQAVATLNYS